MEDLFALNDLLTKSTLEEDERAGNELVSSKKTPSTSVLGTSSKRSSSEQLGKPATGAKGNISNNKGGDENAIWDDAEIDTAHDAALKADDGRKKPEYDIVYKQAVGAETVYFGMGDIDPSSTCCSEIVVKVKLPGQKHKDLDLDVQRQSLIVSSPDFRLATYLPFPVDSESGSAKWVADTCTLCVTLPILDE